MVEPDYYVSNGLSPIGAFKQGLISKEEYRGFLIGNIIKYTIRAGKKDNAIEDLKKARNYIDFYLELLNIERIGDLTFDIKINDDVDWDKLKEEIENALGDANKIPAIIASPTEDPHIVELKVNDIFYDENGEMTPKAKETIKKYLEERRNHE